MKKLKTMVILPGLLLACTLLNGGCFGGLVAYPKTTTYDHFSIGLKMGHITPETNPENPTTERVLAQWGLPDSKRNQTDNAVVWRYKGGWVYAGVCPIFFAPAPLIVPIGNEYVDFYIKDGVAVKAVKHISDGVGYVTGQPVTKGFESVHGNMGDSFGRQRTTASSTP